MGALPTLHELLEPMTKSEDPILGFSHEEILSVVEAALTRSKDVADPSIPRGGESHGLKRLQYFCTNHAACAKRSLADTCNNQSSHFSPYLAFGCLSPRRVVEEAQANGKGCDWIISHMTMRDFFLYTCLATNVSFYSRDGIPISSKRDPVVWNSLNDKANNELWIKWAMGKTGLPLVDAAMTELRTTGYCSNRVRQNAASVLTKDLCIDWRAGAEWFQFLLEDHCVGANWGNWLYFSGVGPDPKQRHFRTVSQAFKYDADGTYVKKWLPKLALLQGEESFLRPWDFGQRDMQPVVSPETQYTWRDLQRLTTTGFLRESSDSGGTITDTN